MKIENAEVNEHRLSMTVDVPNMADGIKLLEKLRKVVLCAAKPTAPTGSREENKIANKRARVEGAIQVFSTREEQALHLGISIRTLFRWLDELGIEK